MIKLTVMTTYRKRIKNFMEYAKHIKTCSNPEIEFILVSLGDDDSRVKDICQSSRIKYIYKDYQGIFSNGYGHNIAAEIASGKWLFKLDVDCIPYVDFFDKLLNYIKKYLKEKKDFLNVGCYFMYSNYEIKNNLINYYNFKNIQNRDIKKYNKEKIGGMLYVVNRQHYLDIGGTPKDFIGFGWEDYYIIYLLQKKQNPNFKLSEYPEGRLHVIIREEIARPVQNKTNKKGLITVHLYHDKNRNSAFYQKAKENRKVLYEKVMEYENISKNL